MTDQNKTQLATEKMQSDFTLFNELTKRLGDLRKTKMTQAEVQKCDIEGLIKKHTGLNIEFSIDPSDQVNAYMMMPMLDRNHPFLSSRGWDFPIETNDRKYITKKGQLNVTEVWIDESNYTVGGGWSKIPVKVCLLKGLMKLKKITDGGVAAIFLHELGHVYTFFSLFGKLTTKNFLTAEAIKNVMGSEPLEKRVQNLKLVEDAMHIELKNKEAIAQASEKTRADLLESIIIAETSIKGGTTSANSKYDYRNIEQIADQFAIYHGAGGDLAAAMTTMYQDFGSLEAKPAVVFVIVELIKVALLMYIAINSPILAIIMLILSIPGHKIYDSPEARVELMRKQLVASLKEAKGQPELHKQLMDQIKTFDEVDGVLKDRRTLYTLIYQTISPRGRTMYRQEVFMKSVENLLYNDTYLNAARFGALTDAT